jgi:hypothetical protein
MCGQTFIGLVMVSLVWLCHGVAALKAAATDEASDLAKARLEVAIKGFESAETVHELCFWSQRLLDSELNLCRSSDDRIAALEKQLKRLEKLEKTVTEGFKRENYTVNELMDVKFIRVDTQYKLAEEKAQKALMAK